MFFSDYNKRYFVLDLNKFMFYFSAKKNYTLKDIKVLDIMKIKKVGINKSNQLSRPSNY